MCGRAVGYGFSSPDAFTRDHVAGDTIDIFYLHGVSVTTDGPPRQHIWSFAVGHGADGFRCPCDNTNRIQAPLPPSFVGENYFCDGTYNGALWDGEDCTTACCTFNSPPYFTTTLPAPTSDDIEVRLCASFDARLSVMQIFVQ